MLRPPCSWLPGAPCQKEGIMQFFLMSIVSLHIWCFILLPTSSPSRISKILPCLNRLEWPSSRKNKNKWGKRNFENDSCLLSSDATQWSCLKVTTRPDHRHSSTSPYQPRSWLMLSSSLFVPSKSPSSHCLSTWHSPAGKSNKFDLLWQCPYTVLHSNFHHVHICI